MAATAKYSVTESREDGEVLLSEPPLQKRPFVRFLAAGIAVCVISSIIMAATYTKPEQIHKVLVTEETKIMTQITQQNSIMYNQLLHDIENRIYHNLTRRNIIHQITVYNACDQLSVLQTNTTADDLFHYQYQSFVLAEPIVQIVSIPNVFSWIAESNHQQFQIESYKLITLDPVVEKCTPDSTCYSCSVPSTTTGNQDTGFRVIVILTEVSMHIYLYGNGISYSKQVDRGENRVVINNHDCELFSLQYQAKIAGLSLYSRMVEVSLVSMPESPCS